MQRMWLVCLCMFLLAQQPESLVIDDFETQRNWNPLASKGCSIKTILDRADVKEGQASLQIDVEFAASCEQQQCYAGISRIAPDLTGYTFLRLWMKAEEPDVVYGIHLGLKGDRERFTFIPFSTQWQLVTVSLAQDFIGGEERLVSVNPEDIETISVFVIADKPVTVRLHVDEFTALADLNNNRIPDVDEASLTESALNAEEIGDNYFAEQEYENAKKYYEEAKSSYLQLGNQEKVQEMEKKVRESTAWINFEEAEELYSQGQYNEAAEVYEKARKDFVAVGNVEMVDLVEGRLEELTSQEETVSPPASERGDDQTVRTSNAGKGIGRLFLVLVIVCIVGVGVYVWKFKGEKPEKPETEKLEKGENLEKKELEPPKTIKCPFCNHEIGEEWVSCPHCGTRLADDTRIY